MTDTPQDQPTILHVCTRDSLRPLRDEILRLSGFHVDSTVSPAEALTMFQARPYSLALIDIEGEQGVHEAETLCARIREITHGQLVAFVCNWRVDILSSCPDDIVHTQFNPKAFVDGVREVLARR